MSSIGLYKWKVSLASRQNWLCSQETKPNVIEIQNFYFLFHNMYRPLCIETSFQNAAHF